MNPANKSIFKLFTTGKDLDKYNQNLLKFPARKTFSIVDYKLLKSPILLRKSIGKKSPHIYIFPQCYC